MRVQQGNLAVIFACMVAGSVKVAVGSEPPGEKQDETVESESRFPDVPMPLRLEGFPQRPKPILELGEPFLGTGTLDPGFELPGGNVVQPSLLLFGTYRTALQAFDNGTETFSEWANRLDLFMNLQFSGTERFLVGIRPLDKDGGFSGYNFEPNNPDGGWQDEWNADITTLFFEGDLGEMFSDADPEDFKQNDLGIAVGRQSLFFQEGMLINDTIDAVGITRNTLLPAAGSNLRLTFVYGWDNIDRNNNEEDGGTSLFGLFTEADFPKSTIAIDAVYVYDKDDETSGFVWGISGVQRIDKFNTSFRYLGSQAEHGDTPQMSSGHLFFGEVSWTPHHTVNNAYVNAFWAIDQFASAARDPSAGGPLGRTGILFAAVGLGRYGAALGNRADNSAGAAIGYQMFFDETRKQLTVEFGGRDSTEISNQGIIALGGRYQQAIGQHTILRFDGFSNWRDEGDDGWGVRVELQFKF